MVNTIFFGLTLIRKKQYRIVFDFVLVPYKEGFVGQKFAMLSLYPAYQKMPRR